MVHVPVSGSDKFQQFVTNRAENRRLSAGAVFGVRKIVWSDGFWAHYAPFFALRPAGRECPFFSPRALTAVSHRGLRCRGRGEFCSQVTRHTLA